jgi:hypothetical protein
MVVSSHHSTDRGVEHLRKCIRGALTKSCPEDYEEALSLKVRESSAPDDDRTSLHFEGPDGASVNVDLEFYPIDEEICHARAETDTGHCRHFWCDRWANPGDSNSIGRIGRAVASFLLHEIERTREIDLDSEPTPSPMPPHVPRLMLDADGYIENLTQGARHLLEYSREASIEPSFFSHVHGQNLQRVMRDLARMVSHRKPKARWLLRMRTGNHRWRWCRAIAQNRLDDGANSIQILLRPL